MANAEKAEIKKNLEKEISRGEPFEIVTLSENSYDAILEISELLIKRNLSYLEMNEVLVNHNIDSIDSILASNIYGRVE